MAFWSAASHPSGGGGMMFPQQGIDLLLPIGSLANWQGRARFRRVPVSVFASAYPCGPP